MLNLLSPYLKPQKTGLLVFCLLTLLSTGINVINPYISGVFIDCISYGGSKNEVIKIAIIAIIIGAMAVFLSFISQIFTAKFKTSLSFKMTTSIINHVQRCPLLVIQKLDPTYLTSRITGDVDIVLSFFLNNIVNVFLSFAVAAISLIILFRLNITIFFVSLLCMPVYALLYFLLKKPLFFSRKKYIEIKNKFTAKIVEQLNLVEEIKTEGAYQKSHNRIRFMFTDVFKFYLNAIKVSSIFSSIDSIILLIFQSINMIWCGVLVANGKLTIGQYTIINVYFSYVLNKLQYFLGLGQSYQETVVSYKRIEELLCIEEEHNGDLAITSIEKIEIKNLSFDYNTFSDKTSKLLYDCNLHIEKGKMTCLIGNNGSGKSTLINIILGNIQDNIDGLILYNDNSINNLDIIKAKDELISVVRQNPKYQKNTIRAILYENEKEDVIELAKTTMEKWGIAYFYQNDQFDFLESLDKEMSEFSGGERQKLALLFALIKEPDFLILDEPSSAMDKTSIELLLTFLEKYKQQHIVLCITHESCIINSSDYILELVLKDTNCLVSGY